MKIPTTGAGAAAASATPRWAQNSVTQNPENVPSIASLRSTCAWTLTFQKASSSPGSEDMEMLGDLCSARLGQHGHAHPQVRSLGLF
jgi:hypothetical protein